MVIVYKICCCYLIVIDEYYTIMLIFINGYLTYGTSKLVLGLVGIRKVGINYIA